METVTPVNPGEAKEVQQIQLQTSAQAIQVAQLVMELIEKLLSNLEKKDKKEQKNNQEQGNNQSENNQSSTAQDNKPSQNSPSSPYQDNIPSPASNSFNNLEITINGEKKLGDGKNNLTWEDYGKLQALVTQDVENTLPELANIKVEKLTQKDGSVQRQTLLETDDNGTVLQNFAKQSQEEKKISGFDAINRALSKLPDNETKTYLSQVNQQINQQFQQQQKLLENAQNLNQKLSQQIETSQSTLLESQKINQDYAKLLQEYQQAQQYRHPKDVKGWQNLVKNPLTPVKQWWQEQQQKWQEKSEDKRSAITVRDFAKKVIGKDNKISGDNYDIERNGQNYQLKSKEGKVLLNFENQGLLGIKINQANLTQFNKDDLHFLDKGLRKDPTFLVKNPQFFSLPEPQSQSELKKNDNVTVKSFSDLDKGVKRIKNNNNSNLNFSHNLDKEAVINPQPSITIQEFSRKFLKPKWSEELNQYVTTGFDKEIGWETQKVPSEIANAVYNNQFRINDNYPPQQGEVALIAREFDKYAVFAVATKLIDDKDRPLVGYRYFWLEKEGNVDGVGTLLNWWEENEKPHFELKPSVEYSAELKEKQNNPRHQTVPLQKVVISPSEPPLRQTTTPYLYNINNNGENLPNNYREIHKLALSLPTLNTQVSWAWNTKLLEKQDDFTVIAYGDTKAFEKHFTKLNSNNVGLQDLPTLVKGLKEIIAKTGSDIEAMNIKGYGIKTDKKGEYIRINRFSDQQILFEKGGTNSTVKSTLNKQDIVQLNSLINKALTKIQKPSEQQLNHFKGR